MNEEPSGKEANCRSTPSRFLLFTLDAGRYALSLEVVERVVPALELTPLPNAPDIVQGVFNLQGRIVPVMNLRRRFGLPERAIELSDHLIVAQTSGRTVGLVVDDTQGIVETAAAEIVPADAFLPELPYVRGVIRLQSGIVLIHDLARFLSLPEARRLDSALAEATRP